MPRVIAAAELLAHLSRPRWSVKELLSAPLQGEPPSHETVQRISKLAGLAPTEHTQADLVNQLRFVETLSAVNTDGVEPLSRLTHPVECPDLDNVIEEAQPEKWNPPSLATERVSDFYVVKEGLRHE